jgi:hypothetical protein
LKVTLSVGRSERVFFMSETCMQLCLTKFRPQDMEDNRIVVVIAKRGAGKSFLTRDLMWFKKHIPFGVVMSGTEEGNGFFSKYVPDAFIYNEFRPDIIAKIIKRQKRLCKKNAPNNGVFLILDDCAFDRRIFRDINMRALFLNGRHWNIFTIMTLQYSLDMPPDLRANIDYLFALREPIIQNRERLYKSFFGMLPSFDSFQQVFNQCTENNEMLVMDNTSRSNKIEDCLHFYKARDPGKFRMGAADYWSVHRSVYNPNHDADDDANDNVTDVKPKRKGTEIVVKKQYTVK